MTGRGRATSPFSHTFPCATLPPMALMPKISPRTVRTMVKEVPKVLEEAEKEQRRQRHRKKKKISKLAAMLKYTKAQAKEKVKLASELSRKINKDFGLPLHVKKKGVRSYEQGGGSEAQSADRSQYPITGISTANISSTSNTMNPSSGPGGV